MMMNTKIFVLILIFAWRVEVCDFNKINDTLYLMFPKGTTLSVQICMTYQLGVTPGSIFTEAVNWGINYPLEIKDVMKNDTENQEETLLRRERRSLFRKFEKIIINMGYNGKHCILRALCEFSKLKRDTFEYELLKIFFEYTSEKLISYENRDDVTYHQAQIHGESKGTKGCFQAYPGCHFSLIDLLLGMYDYQNLID